MAARVLAGRYELTSLVGRGGMGEVWEGRDRVIGRRVAIKLLPHHADDTGAELFFREARTAGQLNHRGVITVFDIGQDPDDRTLFLVMEFVTGRDLATLLRQDGPPPVSHAVDWAAQAAAALAAAHTAGVVHRDLKPANLMLTDGGEIKVLDFGIARFMAATGKSSQVMGTLAYMPPERFAEHPGDERSDLYALGCVLHELLTGATPFQATGPVAMMTAHLNKAPTPPGELRPEVPAALDELVLKLLSKEAAHRPASATDVRDALRALHATLPAPTVADRVPVAPRPSSAPAAPPAPGSPPASPGPSGPPATARDPRPAPVRDDQASGHGPHALPTRTALPPRPAQAPHPTAPEPTFLTRRRALWLGLGTTAVAAVGIGAALLNSGDDPADDQRAGSTGSAGGPSPSSSPTPVHRGWHHPLDVESDAKMPALGDKALYAIDDDALHALDLTTGKQVWRARTGKESPDRVATTGSLVFVACRNVALYAFDGAGKPKWQWHPNPRPQYGFEIGARDDVVCVVVDKTLVCLNARTGKPKWTFVADDFVLDVMPADGTVYVSDRNNGVYAVHAGTGSRRWKVSAARDTRLGLTELPQEKAVAVVAGAKVRALDAGDGREKWATTVKGVGSQGLSPAVVAGDKLYVGGDGRLAHALRATDGRLLWSGGAGGGTAPAVAAGRVYVAGRDDDASTVHALDAKDGSRIWSYDSGSSIDGLTSNHPLVHGGLVFVANELGISAIDAATGQDPPA